MRILDCKSPVCKEIAAGAPVITDYLCQDCAGHYAEVQKKLNDAGLTYTKNPHIVRGLDYYTKTVFELLEPDTGLALLGGGRYDGLVREIDGKADVCGLGFASGIERLIDTMEKKRLSFGEEQKPKIFIAAIGEKGACRAEKAVEELREKGIGAEIDLMGRSLKAQMKYADKIGAEFSTVFGDSEADGGRCILKNMRDGTQKEIAIDEICNEV